MKIYFLLFILVFFTVRQILIKIQVKKILKKLNMKNKKIF